jgi:predicted dithiol-disulfide oxidoreductase (DUF899 family)
VTRIRLLAGTLDGALVHLNHRDVTLICFSRAPIERLVAYKERMGWQLPYVSTYKTKFPFDFGLALTQGQAQQVLEVKEMIDNAPAGSKTGRTRWGHSSRTLYARPRASWPWVDRIHRLTAVPLRSGSPAWSRRGSVRATVSSLAGAWSTYKK